MEKQIENVDLNEKVFYIVYRLHNNNNCYSPKLW